MSDGRLRSQVWRLTSQATDSVNVSETVVDLSFEYTARLFQTKTIHMGLELREVSKQFITRGRVVWPHLPQFQGCGTRRSRVNCGK